MYNFVIRPTSVKSKLSSSITVRALIKGNIRNGHDVIRVYLSSLYDTAIPKYMPGLPDVPLTVIPANILLTVVYCNHGMLAVLLYRIVRIFSSDVTYLAVSFDNFD